MSEAAHMLPAGVKSLLENYPSCALWIKERLMSMPADDKSAHDWAKDTDHKRVVDVMDSITGGKISKPARDALRGVLDKADAPPTGRAKSDAGLGRAIRYAD